MRKDQLVITFSNNTHRVTKKISRMTQN